MEQQLVQQVEQVQLVNEQDKELLVQQQLEKEKELLLQLLLLLVQVKVGQPQLVDQEQGKDV
jgi:hypothetical protein